MRRELSKEVRREFRSKLARTQPQFRPVSRDWPGQGSGLYQWSLAPGTSFFVFLQTAEGQDRFTVEVAYSENENYPGELTHAPEDLVEVGADGVASGPTCRLRLGQLFRHEGPSKRDYWWVVIPDRSLENIMEFLETLREPEVALASALQRIGPLVSDAVAKCSEYGIPFLQEFASRRRVQRPA